MPTCVAAATGGLRYSAAPSVSAGHRTFAWSISLNRLPRDCNHAKVIGLLQRLHRIMLVRVAISA